MTVLFVVGPPGAGKTTLVRAMLGVINGELPLGGFLVPRPKWTVVGGACAAGHYTGATFDGADTVGYSGVDAAIAFWRGSLARSRLTVLDGDRFSYAGSLAQFQATHRTRVIYATVADETLSRRLASRGSTQNAAWMRGRASKALNFAALFDTADRLDLDLSGDVAILAERALEFAA
jgi:ribose 1,5-bisphosphokinase PhnN